MRMLVCGGAGFIGCNFVRMCLSEWPDVHVTVLDKLTYCGRLENLACVAGDPRFSFLRGDICDPAAVDKAIEDTGVVVNFAAESHVDRSIDDSAPFLRTNVEGVRVLLDAVRRHGVERFIQVSTDEVYGDIPGSGRFVETDVLAPSSPYSASKAAGDLLARAYHRTFGVPVVITRCSNNYGPYQYPEKLIPFFISLLLKGEKVPVYGDGLNVRDWIHVQDHCRGIVAVLLKGEAGEVYNIGGDSERTNLEITRIILDAMGKDESCIQHVKDRPGHDRRYAIDHSKITKALGWEPRVPFEKGLRDTVAWYLENQSWAEAVLRPNTC